MIPIKFKKIFMWTASLLFLLSFNTAAEIQITYDLTRLDISSKLSVYTPTEPAAPSIHEAQRLMNHDGFTPNTASALILGESVNGYWIKGRISGINAINSVNNNLVLRFLYHHMGDAYLFLRREDGSISENRFLRPSKNNPQLSAFYLTFPLSIGKEAVDFLVYVNPKGVSYNVYNIHTVIQNRDNYEDEKLSHVIFFSIVFGFIVAMFLYNLVLYAFVGYKPYIYYCAYLVALFILDYSATGFGYLGFIPLDTTTAVNLIAISPNLVCLCLLQFGRTILNLRQTFPRVDRFYQYSQILWLITIPVTITEFHLFNIGLIYTQILTVSSLAVVAYLLHRRLGLPGALAFTLSFIALLIGSVAHISLEYFSFDNLIPSDTFFTFYRWSEKYIFHLFSMLEMILLSIALAAFIRQAERDRQKAQDDKMALLSQSIELKEQYSTQLETEVKARTQELDQKASELNNLHQLRDRFFHYITHEFRAPLTLAIGPLADIRSGKYGPLSDSVKNAIILVEQNTQKMLYLVNQILNLARQRNHYSNLNIVQFDALDSLAQLLDHYTYSLEQKAIKLEVHNQIPHTGILWFDRHYFEAIFSNLLSNACKHTPPGGQVTLTYTQHDDMLDISIHNTGSYIPASQQDRIFDHFYKGNGSFTRDDASSGIGLTLVKEFIDLHNGEITVNSDQNKGTAFTVKLRQGKDHFSGELFAGKEFEFAASVSRSAHTIGENVTTENFSDSQPDEQDSHQDKTKVLLVDDNQELLAYLSQRLQDADFQVITAENGEQGFQRCKQALPDIVISDVIMPVSSGLELLQRIRNDKDLNDLPVILLTSEADKPSQINGITQGADDYLTKPFIPAELLARIQRIYQQRQAVKEKYLAHHALTHLKNSGHHQQNIKNRAMEIIHHHLSDSNFTVEQLADQLHINRSTLHRQLKEKYQTTANRLILQTRLEAARQLLKTDSRLTSIAFAVGFKSQSYFTKKFGEYYGHTPSQWRKLHTQE